MRTPNYVLTAEHRISNYPHDDIILTKGMFVRPVDKYYLPKHVKESSAFRWHSEEKEVFCYTSVGIVCVPKEFIRMVD